MEYRHAAAAAESTRPTRLTVIGVVSVCIGVIGLLGHLSSFVTVAQLFQMSAPLPPPRPRPGPALPPLPKNAEPYRGELARAGEGLARAQREIVVAAVEKKISLPSDRKEMLRRLLAERGQRIMGGASENTAAIAAAHAAAQITEAGQLPAGRDGLRTLGTHYFRTPSGAVLLDDALARWHPTTSADADDACRINGNRFLAGSKAPRLTIAVVEDELDRLREQLGPGFNPVQARVVAEWLMRYDQPYLVKRANDPLPTRDAQMLAGVTFAFGNKNDPSQRVTWILADGRTIARPDHTLDPATGLPRIAISGGPPAPPPPPRYVTRAMAWTCVLLTLLGVALGAYVLYCGILTMQNAPRAGRHHARWAWLELVTGVATAPPWIWITHAHLRQMAATTPGLAGMVEAMWAVIIVFALLWMAYPVIVLVMLRHSSVIDFYTRRGGPVTLFDRATWEWMGERIERTSGRGAAIVAAAGILVLLIAYLVTTATMAWVVVVLGVTAVVVCVVRIATGAPNAVAGAGLIAILMFGPVPGPVRDARAQTTQAADAEYQRVAALLPEAADAAHIRRFDPALGRKPPSPEAKKLAEELKRRTNDGDLILFRMLSDEDIRVGMAAARILDTMGVGGRLPKFSPQAKEMIVAALPRLAEMIETRGGARPPRGRGRPATDPAVRARELERAREIARAPRRPDVEQQVVDAVESLVYQVPPSHTSEMVNWIGGPFHGVAVSRLSAQRELSPEMIKALEAKAALLINRAMHEPRQYHGSATRLLRRIRTSPAVWTEMRNAFTRAPKAERWMVELPRQLIERGDGLEREEMKLDANVRDDLMLIAAAKGGLEITHGSSAEGDWFDYQALASDPQRLLRGLKSDDQLVRQGAAAVSKRFATRDKDVADALKKLPAHDNPAVVLDLASRKPEEFEYLTRDAIVSNDATALDRLRAAAQAPTPQEWRNAQPWTPGRDMEPLAIFTARRGWMMGSESMRQIMLSGDPGARRHLALALRDEIFYHRLPQAGPTWHAMIAAAAAGEDPQAAANKLAAARESRWGKPSPFAIADRRAASAGTGTTATATPSVVRRIVAAGSAIAVAVVSAGVLLLGTARVLLTRGER
jgi:hypothetical protein